MNKLIEIGTKICRKWTKIRLHPIRVFCFHHVSDVYDASYMCEEDWIRTEKLKHIICDLQSDGYTFISLPDAYEKIKQDRFRRQKYAVLTSDDGFRSLLNILPWLKEQKIPLTLFVNPKYILDDSIGENTQSQLNTMQSKVENDKIYLKSADIQTIQSPLISFGYHGYEHLDEWNIDNEMFVRNVEKCMECMRDVFQNVIPFYAHTYGHSKGEYNRVLEGKNLVPVYVSGGLNYNDATRIDRELISNKRILNKQL